MADPFTGLIVIGLFVSAGTSAATAGVQRLFAPKPKPVVRGKYEGDINVQNSAFGQIIPLIYGANPEDNKGGGVVLAGNVIWTSGIRKKSSTQSGGKGPRRPEVTDITYDVDVAILVAEGQCKITKIWANTELIYNGDQSTEGNPGGNSGIYDDGEPPDSNYDQFLPPDPLGEYSTARYNGTATPDGDGVVHLTSSAGTYAGITIYPGNYTQQPDPLIQAQVDGKRGANSTPAYRGRCYVVFEKFNISKFGGVIPSFTFQVENKQLKTLDTICSDLCRRAGLAESDFGFDNLAGIPCRGFLVYNRQSPRDILELLAQTYNFEFYEDDGVIRATVLGTEATTTIPKEDLGAQLGEPKTESDQPLPLVESTLLDEPQLPVQIEVKFFDVRREGQSNTQSALRQVVRSEKIESFDLPATLIPKEARQIAKRELYRRWIERNGFALSVPWKYGYLKPTDVVLVDVSGFTYSIRLKEVIGTLPDVVQLKGVAQDVSIFNPVGEAGPGDYEPFPVNVPAPSVGSLFTLPFLRPGDVGLGYYAAAAPRTSGSWVSATLWKDLGLGFEQIAKFTQPATMGASVGALGTFTGTGTDTTNTLTVDLYFGELASSTTEDLDAGANLAIIGNELIQWETATQVAGFPNRYNLTNLRRGVKMTNAFIGSHVTGERFVQIDSSCIFVETLASEAGIERTYKVVTEGQTLDDAASFTFIWTGNPNSADTDSGPPNIAKVTTAWVAAKRRLPDDKILTTLEIRCPGRFTDPTANFSRVDAAVISVLDKFGTTILDSQVVPFSGDGVLPAITHNRKNAEPTGFTPNQPDFEVNLPEATYKVQIRNRFGLSDPIWIRGRSFTLPQPTYLTASIDHPQNLIAVPISDTEVRLNWTCTSSNPALITWYKIPNDSTPATAYAGDTAGAVNTYTVSNLAPNTNYDFRVDVNQKYSNIIAAKTFEGDTQTAFPAPTGLVVTENYTNRVRIEWDYVDGGFSAVEIWRDSTLLFTDSVNPASGDGFSDFYTDHTVAGNTTYVFKVRYVYGTNASDFTTVSTTTPAATYSPPEIKTTSPDSGPAGDTRTRLMLRDLVDGNTGGVEIYRNGVLLTTLTDLPSGVDGYYFNDSSLNPNTAYTYKARNKYPSSNYSAFTPDFVITTTNVGSNVTTPTTFTVTGTTETTISLSWVNPGATPTQWRIYVNGVFKTTVTGSSTSTTLTALLPDTTYSIAIIARYGGDYPHFASLTSSTGTNTSYPAPTTFAATAISISQINLSWTRNSSTNTGVEVWRFNSATGAFELFTTLLATATSYSNTGLTANTLYRYKIRHVYAGGIYSNFTAEANATTSAITYPAPTSLAAVAASSTQVDLTWVRNSTTNTAVEVWRNDSLLVTLGATVTNYSDPNLTPNTQYSYKLRHKYSGGNFSAFTNSVTVTTQSGTVFLAPSSLQATAITETRIDISWLRNSTTNTNVGLYRNGVLIATLGATVINYSDTTVQPSTTYTYKAQNLFSGGGQSAFSNESTATTPASTSYPAPSSLDATAASPTSIGLTWIRNTTANTGVQVYRGLGASPVAYTLVTTLSGSATSYTDTGLTPSTQYTYYVKNIFPGGNASNNSNTDSATTQAEPTYPPPTTLVATASPGQVGLTWVRNSTTNINVQVWRVETTGANETLLATLAATATNYTDTTGIVGVIYYYKVRHVYTGPIYSAFAQSGSVQFPSQFPAPTSLTADAPTTSGVNLTWVRNTTSNDETRIQRSGGLDFPLYIVAPTATSYTDTNILPNAAYTYTVQHRYGSNFSAPSNAASVIVPNGAYPPPANFTAQAQGGSAVALSWQRVVTSNTGFEIYRNGAFLVSVGASVTSYTDTGLTSQTGYSYKVRATYPSSGLSEFTPELLITTGPPDFPAPQNLRVTGKTSFSVDLAWKRNSDSNTKVQVHRKTGAGGTYSQIADLSPATTTYTDLTVSPGTTYFYKVRHRYAGGDLSEFSNEVSTTTN